mmetsp:Transcript_14757/g.35059  ORF Transcript_14757/g.35059 Transcript_14757/m.35059 type:complete len:316 (-) Transcript_14757:560-1507(-)|eukprot:1685044-Rhodomonas_salina.2
MRVNCMRTSRPTSRWARPRPQLRVNRQYMGGVWTLRFILAPDSLAARKKRMVLANESRILAVCRSSEVGIRFSPLNARFTNSSLCSPATSVQNRFTSSPETTPKLLSSRIVCTPHRTESSHAMLRMSQSRGSVGDSLRGNNTSIARQMRMNADSSRGVMLARMFSYTESAIRYDLKMVKTIRGHRFSPLCGQTMAAIIEIGSSGNAKGFSGDTDVASNICCSHPAYELRTLGQLAASSGSVSSALLAAAAFGTLPPTATTPSIGCEHPDSKAAPSTETTPLRAPPLSPTATMSNPCGDHPEPEDGALGPFTASSV